MCRNCFKYAEYLSEFDRAVLDIIFTSELPYLDLLYKQISVAAVLWYTYHERTVGIHKGAHQYENNRAAA